MGVVKIVDLRIKEWKGQQKLIEMIPICFLTIIVQLCINKTNNVLHTNYIALHITPNMANNTQWHGYMKKERSILKLDNKKYIFMDTWHLHQVTRMENKT